MAETPRKQKPLKNLRGVRVLQGFLTARATGLEPATTGSTVRYSNQLSYAPVRFGATGLG